MIRITVEHPLLATSLQYWHLHTPLSFDKTSWSILQGPTENCQGEWVSWINIVIVVIIVIIIIIIIIFIIIIIVVVVVVVVVVIIIIIIWHKYSSTAIITAINGHPWGKKWWSPA